MRTVLLCHDRFGPLESKTAASILRYSTRHEVVAVLDRTKAGTTADVWIRGSPPDIPVLGSLSEALQLKPETLVLGAAPMGGGFDEAWRDEVREALENGIHVESGLHTFLSGDPEFASIASRMGAGILDARRPVKPPRIATGEAAKIDALVVHTMGTDCSSGKMTTSVEMVRHARARGIRAAFAATGQTGILIGADAGAPVDRIVSDFAAGAAEETVLECAAKGADLIVVEGQGSLDHYAYSGVTLALLHGCYPDAVILCHQAGRRSLGEDKNGDEHPVQDLRWHIETIERMSKPVHPTLVVGIALATFHLPESEARLAIRDVEEATGLACTDPVRFGAGPLLDACLAHAEATGKPNATYLITAAEGGRVPTRGATA